MSNAYVGPGWEHPEHKEIFGGSTADVYIHDGFTVAVLDEVGFMDRQQGRRECDVAIFLPIDEHRSTPARWMRDLDEAEKYIARQRAEHPEWPTVPVPLLVSVPRFKMPSDAREHVEQIVEVLESREDFNLHGEGVWMLALGVYVHCQHMFIDQKAIDQARMMRAVYADLKI